MTESLGYYKLLERIGVGALGEVYRARDTRVGRTVVVRLVPDGIAADPDRRDALLATARTVSRLSHPNIAGLFEIGEDASRLFLVYEHVAGESLRVAVAGRPMKLRRAVDITVQIADALAEGHATGLVHGDLTPDNILLTQTGHPKLLDFGLAGYGLRGVARAAVASQLADGQPLGSAGVEYMAPEQVLGERGDERSDVFSLGAILYEMLTGEPPFRASTSQGTALEVVKAVPPPPSGQNPQVGPELDAIVGRALAKSLDARFQSAASFATALRDAGEKIALRDAEDSAGLVPAALGGRKSRGTVVTVIVLTAIAASAWLGAGSISAAWRRWFGTPPAPVLTIVGRTTGGGDSALGEGFAADLRDRFGHTAGFTVPSRSGPARALSEPVDIARDAGAAVVLSADLSVEGDALSVETNLVDVASGDSLDTARHAAPLASVLALQYDIVRQVAERLDVPISASPAQMRATSRVVVAEGFALYLRGRAAAAAGDLDRAADLFRQASAADPGLAEAHAALARTLMTHGMASGTVDLEAVRRLAGNALAIDADLAASQIAAGLAAAGTTDAVARFRRAAELDPTSGLPLAAIGDELAALDPARALDFYRAAVRLDRRLEWARLGIARVRGTLGEIEAAERELGIGPDAPAQAGLAPALFAVLGAQADPTGVSAAFPASAPPGYALTFATAVGSTRPEPALAVVRQALAVDPAYCEARAVASGLDLNAGRAVERAVLDELAREREAAGSPADLGCAAMAAAASGDATRVQAILLRVAADPAALRWWLRPVGGSTLRNELRLRRFPWSRLPAGRPIADAEAALDKACDRLREEVSAALRGLPQS